MSTTKHINIKRGIHNNTFTTHVKELNIRKYIDMKFDHWVTQRIYHYTYKPVSIIEDTVLRLCTDKLHNIILYDEK